MKPGNGITSWKKRTDWCVKARGLTLTIKNLGLSHGNGHLDGDVY